MIITAGRWWPGTRPGREPPRPPESRPFARPPWRVPPAGGAAAPLTSAGGTSGAEPGGEEGGAGGKGAERAAPLAPCPCVRVCERERAGVCVRGEPAVYRGCAAAWLAPAAAAPGLSFGASEASRCLGSRFPARSRRAERSSRPLSWGRFRRPGVPAEAAASRGFSAPGESASMLCKWPGHSQGCTLFSSSPSASPRP